MAWLRASKSRPLSTSRCVIPRNSFHLLHEGRARPQPPRRPLHYSAGMGALRILLGLSLPAFNKEPDERQEIQYLQGVRFAQEEENVVVCLYAHHCRHG